ncbi:MAG: aminopeptidase [Chloroflexota bacterium]
MLDQTRLAQIAEKLVFQAVAIKRGETVSIVRDSEAESAVVAQAVLEACVRAGTDPVTLIMQPRSINGAELPEPMAGAFVRSNVIINLGRTGLAHVRAATSALQAGGRMGSLRDWDQGILESPGVTTNYEVVRRNALATDALLEKGREVRITTAEGTDLTLRLCGRKGNAQTGFATKPGTFTALPDGESTVAPLEGSTNGRIVNPYTMEKIGLIDEPFEMEIRDGWCVGLKGGKQAGALEALLETLDPDARRIASQFAVGMNPDCRVVPNTLEVSKKLGTIHVAMGDNYTLGGTVQSGVHMDIVILNPTITLDGRLLLENGKLYL